MAGTVAAVVLAAGAGQRFGGDKLAALWQGEPLLAHVLRAVSGHSGVVVHRPGDSFALRMAIESGMTPSANPHPEFGLSESLRVGLRALDPAGIEWALIVLGDQPLLRPEVITTLIAATGTACDLVRPVYADAPEAPGHPVLVHRRLWPLTESLRGDQGFGSVVAPERIRLVPVPGSNPDVDTRADLLRLSALPSPLSASDA
jgi:CTP:molybdopterin cytidylyltransferase MocA